MDTYVARQPIFNKKKKLFAYELLFRNSLNNAMPDIEGDTATSKILSSSFYTIGINEITGGHKAFINFTESLILKEFPLLFSKENMVVEILEDVEPTDAIIDACKLLIEKGYTLALDDFVFKTDLEQLIKLAHIIKIDFRLTPIDEIQSCLNKLPSKNIKLLAEKVETNSEFEKALEMGFEYFQGYFFCKPEIIKGKEISTSNVNNMKLMAEINGSEFDFDRVGKLIERDVSISYKLLQYANSSFFKRINKVKKIKQALVNLGENEIRRFISFFLLSKVAHGKPEELIKQSCIRAKFCENLGTISKHCKYSDELFTTGIFSLIDAILDQDIEVIMKKIPLVKEIKQALILQEGELGDYLKLSVFYEKGDWDKVKFFSDKLGIQEDKIPNIYTNACVWSNEIPCKE